MPHAPMFVFSMMFMTMIINVDGKYWCSMSNFMQKGKQSPSASSAHERERPFVLLGLGHCNCRNYAEGVRIEGEI